MKNNSKTLDFSKRFIHLEAYHLSYGNFAPPICFRTYESIEKARKVALDEFGIECRFGHRFDREDWGMRYYGENGDIAVVIYW